MDTNESGKQVPNDLCVLCQEATEDVSYEEHARHVDFIAARGRAYGYHTKAPAPAVWTSEYKSKP